VAITEQQELLMVILKITNLLVPEIRSNLETKKMLLILDRSRFPVPTLQFILSAFPVPSTYLPTYLAG
jgi:hypothetical protein